MCYTFTIFVNSDIVVATPGRLVHLGVEMQLKFDNIQYVVFDEADRLFEMGFGEQLKDILGRLPDHRQVFALSKYFSLLYFCFHKECHFSRDGFLFNLTLFT